MKFNIKCSMSFILICLCTTVGFAANAENGDKSAQVKLTREVCNAKRTWRPLGFSGGSASVFKILLPAASVCAQK